MKLTCLSKGDGFQYPPCHMLNLCGFRILIDCPLDLLAITIFSPITYDDVGFEASEYSSDVPLDAQSPIQKKQKLERQMNPDDLVYAEPWYKTVKALHLWEVSLIDIVLISNPMGLLGLPFLTQNPRFCAKIYITETTAKIGQLMMEDLVSMHMEFRRVHGPEDSSFPWWTKNLDGEEVPALLKKVVFGESGDDLGSWLRLYRRAIGVHKHHTRVAVQATTREGEPSFGYLKFIKDKKIHLFPAIHSPNLITSWQEPCIVFAPHWSLRLGPSVQLLQRWRGDPKSLLVLEDGISSGLGLLPFRPIAMKTLQCSFLSGIRLQKLQTLLSVLQPKIVLVLDVVNQRINLTEMKPIPILTYSENKTLHVPRIADNPDVEIMAELASELSWRKLRQRENFGIARLKGELLMEDGKHRLVSGLEQESSSGKARGLRHWGSVAPQTLLDSLMKMGIIGFIEDSTNENGLEDNSVIHITNPCSGLIENSEIGSVIITDDENVASQIFQAIDGILDGI